MRRKLLGDEHPDVGKSLNNLALILAEDGRLTEAVAIDRELLDLIRRLHGAEHPWVAQSLSNLAFDLREVGNLDEAEHWRLRALEISEGLDYYAEMGSAYNGLAALYNLKGDWNRAIDYARRGLQVRDIIGDVEGTKASEEEE